MRFATVFILMVSLLVSSLSAYSLNLHITGVQGTIGVGTNVTIIKDGVPLFAAKANSAGNASFNVTSGSYFVKLDRSGYPTHILLIDVTKDSWISLSMRQLISYANVYGVVSGPSDFAGAYVSAFSGGKVAGRVATDRNGYYIMQYLPDGNYDLLFEAPGFANKTENAYLVQPVFTEKNAVLSPMKPNTTQAGPITLLVPSSVKLYSLIEVVLLSGDLPYAGQKISVSTPAGSIEVTTDSEGKARINAAQDGKYEFSFGGVKAASKVAAPKPAEQPANTSPIAPPPQTIDEPAPVAPQQSGAANAVLLAIGTIAIVAVVAAVVFLVVVSKKGEKKPPAAGAPQSPQAPHGQTHAHKHPVHHKK